MQIRSQTALDALWPLAVFALVGLVPLYWILTRDVRVEWMMVAWGEAMATPLIVVAALGVGVASRRWWVSLALFLVAGTGVETCVLFLAWPRFTPLDGAEHLMVAGRLVGLLFYVAAASLLMGEVRLQNAQYPAGRTRPPTPGSGPKWWQLFALSVVLLTPVIQYASFFAYRTRLSFLLPLLPVLLVAVISASLFNSPPGLRAPTLRRLATICAGWSLLALIALWIPQAGDYGNVTIFRGIVTDIAALTGIALVVGLIRRFRKETVRESWRHNT